MTLRHWIDIVEAKFRKPAVMFHGTTTEFLPTILKQGIVPRPPRKTWQDDPDTIQTSYSRASLSGSYWTANLMTATSSATNTRKKFGGNSLLVIAQIAQQSAYADEDNLNYSMRYALEQANRDLHPGIRSDFLLPLANALWEQPQGSTAARVRQLFAKYLHEQLAGDPEKHPVDREFTDQLLAALLTREVVWEQRNRGTSVGDWVKNIPQPLPDLAEIDQELQQLRERLTRTYRKTVLDRDSYNQTLRLTQPVTFTGANKILVMLQEQPWEWQEIPGKSDKKLLVKPFILRWGKPQDIPQEFFIQYEQRVGKFPGLVDPGGNILMPSERHTA